MPRIAARHNTGRSGPRNRAPHHSRPTSSFHRSRVRNSSSVSVQGTTGKRTSGNPICGLLIFALIATLVVVSIVVSTIHFTDRPMIINKYNQYTKEWNTNYQEQFRNAHFSFNETEMEIKERKGKYFPVYDKCTTQTGNSGCIATKSIYYYKTITLTAKDQIEVQIKNQQNDILYKEVLNTGYFVIYSAAEMHCDPYASDDESDSCYTKCVNRNGEYDDYTYECKIPYSLVKVCLRVKEVDGRFIKDTDMDLPFAVKDVGCYFANSFKPAVYARQWEIPDEIDVEVRHFNDPVILASGLTEGCSNRYEHRDENHTCFGVHRVWLPVIIIGIIMIPILFLCLGCVVMAKSIKKEEKVSLLSNSTPLAPIQSTDSSAPGSIPTAQPYNAPVSGSIPTAQPYNASTSSSIPTAQPYNAPTSSSIPTAQPYNNPFAYQPPAQSTSSSINYQPSTFNQQPYNSMYNQPLYANGQHTTI